MGVNVQQGARVGEYLRYSVCVCVGFYLAPEWAAPRHERAAHNPSSLAKTSRWRQYDTVMCAEAVLYIGTGPPVNFIRIFSSWILVTQIVSFWEGCLKTNHSVKLLVKSPLTLFCLGLQILVWAGLHWSMDGSDTRSTFAEEPSRFTV